MRRDNRGDAGGAGDGGAGGRSTVEHLLPLVYDELRAIAAEYLRRERSDHTLQPTALVHEAYLRLRRSTSLRIESRAHFIAVAARAIRLVLVDHARRHGAAKRGGLLTRVPFGREPADRAAVRDVDLMALDEALHRLHGSQSRAADVAQLRFFGGLTLDETAEVLAVSRKTIAQDWRFARAWLSVALSEG